MGFFSNIFRSAPPADHPFPDLMPFEKEFDRAIKLKMNKTVSMNSLDLTKEKWDYLQKKYPQLDIPVTHEFHKMHKIYKKNFEKVRSDVGAGNTFSLTEYEEKILRVFVEKELPGTILNVERPSIIKTDIAGFRFHDYKKKAVKEMLAMDPLQELNLEREPDNKFDYFAVKILWENYQLGYVPSKYSTEVSEALDENISISCWMVNYDNFGPIDERTSIEIRIDRALTF